MLSSYGLLPQYGLQLTLLLQCWIIMLLITSSSCVYASYGLKKHPIHLLILFQVYLFQVIYLLLYEVYYLPYIYAIYYWMVGIIGYWVQLGVAFVLGYVYWYLKIYSVSYYGRDLFPTPRIFELLIQKYLIVQRRLGIYKPLI